MSEGWQLPDAPGPVGGLVICPRCRGEGHGFVMKNCTFTNSTLNGKPMRDGFIKFVAPPCPDCKGEGWVPGAASEAVEGEK